MNVNIAVVQFAIEPRNPSANLARIETFIKKAAQKKADVVVFPEDFITGPIERHKEFADAKGLYRAAIASFAKTYGIDVVAGSIIERVGKKYYNTAYYFDAKGKTLGRHRKVYLWDSEKNHFNAGTTTTMFKTRYGKVGLLICWDMAYPKLWGEMMDKGVQVVFCPTYWAHEDAGRGCQINWDSDIHFVNAMATSRAFENETAVVFCNAAKHEKMEHSPLGQSQVAFPFFGPLKRLSHNKEEMFVQKVDLSILKIAEETYQIRSDRRKA